MRSSQSHRGGGPEAQTFEAAAMIAPLHICENKAVQGGAVIGPFAAALLQRGRAVRNPRLCPHCRARLAGDALIDRGHAGIYCGRCDD